MMQQCNYNHETLGPLVVDFVVQKWGSLGAKSETYEEIDYVDSIRLEDGTIFKYRVLSRELKKDVTDAAYRAIR